LSGAVAEWANNSGNLRNFDAQRALKARSRSPLAMCASWSPSI
jgi:hypothetical protein